MKAFKYVAILTLIAMITSCKTAEIVQQTNTEDDDSVPTISQLYEEYIDSLFVKVSKLNRKMTNGSEELDDVINREITIPLRERKEDLAPEVRIDWENFFSDPAKADLFNKGKHFIEVPKKDGEIKKAFAQGQEYSIPIALTTAKTYVVNNVLNDSLLAPNAEAIFDSIYTSIIEAKEQASIRAFVEIEKNNVLNISTPNAFDLVALAGLTDEQKNKILADRGNNSSQDSISRKRSTKRSSSINSSGKIYYQQAKSLYDSGDFPGATTQAKLAVSNGDNVQKANCLLYEIYKASVSSLKSKRSKTYTDRKELRRREAERDAYNKLCK